MVASNLFDLLMVTVNKDVCPDCFRDLFFIATHCKSTCSPPIVPYDLRSHFNNLQNLGQAWIVLINAAAPMHASRLG
jgi:hypothetical protein